MDKVDKAVSTFHKPHSCAQAIYSAFAEESPASMDEMKKNSGGRAPDGVCGAIFAALQIAPEEHHESMAAEFASRAGDLKCRAIKTNSKTSCSECVRIAAEILAARGL